MCEHIDHDRKQVEKIFKFLEIPFNFTNITRLVVHTPTNRQRTGPRTLLVRLTTEFAKNQVISSTSLLKDYGKKIYILSALSPENLRIENELLKERRRLIKENGKKFRLRSLKLQVYEGGHWNDAPQVTTGSGVTDKR